MELNEEGEQTTQYNNGYVIKNKCLIISMTQMLKEIKDKLKNLLYSTSQKDDSPYIYKQLYNPEKDDKKNKNKSKFRKDIDIDEIEYNDYIQINKKMQYHMKKEHY